MKIEKYQNCLSFIIQYLLCLTFALDITVITEPGINCKTKLLGHPTDCSHFGWGLVLKTLECSQIGCRLASEAGICSQFGLMDV